jgi:2,3,4,5-tetrahydropyridine-2-carboxylate N-succinyltransferase
MRDGELKAFFERPLEALMADAGWPAAHAALLTALEAGSVRAAQKAADGSWQAVRWVKEAILIGFRRTVLQPIEAPLFPFFDKPAYPPRAFRLDDGVRLVPGGSAVRRGAYVGKGVVVMPPAYINLGAFVDAGTMVDSHALVGSCAQIGARVHLSAGAQIGGVLEPTNAAPVVVEDDAFVGALAGIFEGFVVRRRAVIASGVVLTRSTIVHDLVHGKQWRGEVPEGAVVVPGSRPASGDHAKAHGLMVAAPMIVKYRDDKTDAGTALEAALR